MNQKEREPKIAETECLDASLPSEDELDWAIEMTFPASDPPAWTTPSQRNNKPAEKA